MCRWRSRSSSSLVLRTWITNSHTVCHLDLLSSIVFTTLSGVNSASVATSSSLRLLHQRSHMKNACSGSSIGAWQSWHAGESIFLNLHKYFPKHPCPVRNWVIRKFIWPNDLETHGRRSGINLLVQSPVTDFSHSFCHLLSDSSLKSFLDGGAEPVFSATRSVILSTTFKCSGSSPDTTSMALVDTVR